MKQRVKQYQRDVQTVEKACINTPGLLTGVKSGLNNAMDDAKSDLETQLQQLKTQEKDLQQWHKANSPRMRRIMNQQMMKRKVRPRGRQRRSSADAAKEDPRVTSTAAYERKYQAQLEPIHSQIISLQQALAQVEKDIAAVQSLSLGAGNALSSRKIDILISASEKYPLSRPMERKLLSLVKTVAAYDHAMTSIKDTLGQVARDGVQDKSIFAGVDENAQLVVLEQLFREGVVEAERARIRQATGAGKSETGLKLLHDNSAHNQQMILDRYKAARSVYLCNPDSDKSIVTEMQQIIKDDIAAAKSDVNLKWAGGTKPVGPQSEGPQELPTKGFSKN